MKKEELVVKEAMTLKKWDLFEVNDDEPRLEESRAELFHSFYARKSAVVPKEIGPSLRDCWNT